MQVYANGSGEADFLRAEMADDGQSLRVATKKKKAHQIYIYMYDSLYFLKRIFSWKARFGDL